ncbi:MAG TPA: hypothetical protein DDW65_11375 [Firmicutes bacterium]|jgi:hypothetical protein|nr:hypothetical protein [Bacillota bacterium]
MFRVKKLKLSLMLIVSVFLFGLSLISVYGAEKTDDLWQKAVQIAAQSQKYIPGNVQTHVEEYNTRGKLTKEEETWLQLTADENNQVKTKCLKALENGKDVTERENHHLDKFDMNKSQKSSKRTLTFGNDDVNPFDPKVQKDVYYHPTDQKETINQQECVLYEYTWKKNDERIQKGTAWLAVDTGLPLKLKFVLDPKPKYVKSFEATANFSRKDGLWHPEIGDMEASGGSWFKHFHVKVHFTLSEYWLYQSNENPTPNQKP